MYVKVGVLGFCFDYNFYYKFVINNRDLDLNIVINFYLVILIK